MISKGCFNFFLHCLKWPTIFCNEFCGTAIPHDSTERIGILKRAAMQLIQGEGDIGNAELSFDYYIE